MYSQWDILASVSLIAEVAGGLIIAEGAIAEEMYILAFVVMLGILTSFIYISGGLLAFSEWAITKVRTRFQAQLVPYVLGLVISGSSTVALTRSSVTFRSTISSSA